MVSVVFKPLRWAWPASPHPYHLSSPPPNYYPPTPSGQRLICHYKYDILDYFSPSVLNLKQDVERFCSSSRLSLFARRNISFPSLGANPEPRKPAKYKRALEKHRLLHGKHLNYLVIRRTLVNRTLGGSLWVPGNTLHKLFRAGKPRSALWRPLYPKNVIFHLKITVFDGKTHI